MSPTVSEGPDELLVAIVGRLTTTLQQGAHNDPLYLAALSTALLSIEENLSSRLEELLLISARREIAASTP